MGSTHVRGPHETEVVSWFCILLQQLGELQGKEEAVFNQKLKLCPVSVTEGRKAVCVWV